MMSDDIAARLQALEARLADLERRVYGPARWQAAPVNAPSIPPAAKPQTAVPAAPPPARTPAVSEARATRSPAPRGEPDSLVTNALGWGGGIALVLAAAY